VDRKGRSGKVSHYKKTCYWLFRGRRLCYHHPLQTRNQQQDDQADSVRGLLGGLPRGDANGPAGTAHVADAGQPSPAGRRSGRGADEGDTPGLFVQSFPSIGAKYQGTVENPRVASWSDRGDALWVIAGDGDLVSIQVSTADGFRQGATTRLFNVAREFGRTVLSN